MQVTLKQIAEISGVHRSTVDKVIHNREGVSDELRQKVKRIIEELGYTPNIIGKALSRQKKRLMVPVLLLKVDSMEEIKAGIEGAYKEYQDFGLEIEFYITSNSDPAEQLSIINHLKSKKISGLIISPLYDVEIKKAIDEMVDEGIPVITTNSDIPESKRMCFVGQDVVSAGRVAGELMGEILNGRGKVAVISAHNLLCVGKRLEGFEAVIKSKYPDIEIVDIVDTFEQGLVAFQKTLSILESVRDLNGIFITCGNVNEVGKAVRLMNKAKEVKIISYDLYPEIVELVKEGIINFTIGQDLFAQGYKPVKILFEYLFYKKTPEVDQIKTSIDIRLRENIDIN
jgi:LacI family transcriptional regulator, galactose operon repressor